jgi:hypothetical protein
MWEIRVLLATVMVLYSFAASAQSMNPVPVPAPAPSTAPTCSSPTTNEAAGSGLPAGVYNTPSGTLYTTGDKKPFIVDPPCNTPPVQPYVEYNAPTAGGSSTTSTTAPTAAPTAPAATPMRR